ncbi:uncharacterized protein LOC144872510 [Branchiostoma floridae x Branchiostoma japonicum]
MASTEGKEKSSTEDCGAKKKEILTKSVTCDPHIRQRNIVDFLHEHQDLSDKDRQLFQEAGDAALVRFRPSDLENAELAVTGRHVDVKFVSGDKSTNQIVAYLDGKDCPKVTVEKTGSWWLWIREDLRAFVNWVQTFNMFKTIVDIIAPIFKYLPIKFASAAT